MASSLRTGADSPSMPFDEQIEDQENEAFLRDVSPPNSPATSTTIGRSVQWDDREQRPPSLPIINEESLRKYKEFERWQKLRQKEIIVLRRKKLKPKIINNQQGPPAQEQQEQQGQHQQDQGDKPRKRKVAQKKQQRKPERSVLLHPIRLVPPKSEEGKLENKDLEEAVSEDIYGLIYTASPTSQAFYFAVFVYLFKQILLLLIVRDLLNFTSFSDLITGNDNVLRVPPGVPIRVNVAQAISMVLVVSTILGGSGDLTNGLGHLIAGYDGLVLAKNPHAHCLKWFTAFLLQTLAGISMTVVLWLLVIQSTTVVGMAFNFAALTFIYEIDNITFEMGKKGFLTSRIKHDCERVTHHVVPGKRLRRHERLGKVLVLSMLICVYVPYGFVVYRQWDSQYLCSKLYIQMSGEAIPDLVYYSGHFHVHKRENKIFAGVRSRIDDRVYYKDSTGSLVVAFCESETAWTISLNTTSHCSYLYKSSSTTSFDITNVAGMTWYTWDLNSQQALPVDLYLRCDDCVNGSRGNCHSHNGYCEDNECICKENRMGFRCENVFPGCQTMRIDARTSELPYEEGLWFSGSYELLRLRMSETNEVVQAHERPVYAAYYYNITRDQSYGVQQEAVGMDFMFFNGRRWVILSRDLLGYNSEIGPSVQDSRIASDDDDGSVEVLEALYDLLGTTGGLSLRALSVMFPLEEILQYQMGNEYANETLLLYRPFFFSEPVSPLATGDNLSPVGLKWHPAQRSTDNILAQWIADKGRQLSTRFLCSECQVHNPCLNSGFCNVDRKCDCMDFFAGSMCEQAVSCHEMGFCFNNGTCQVRKEYCTCPTGYFGSLCQYEQMEALEVKSAGGILQRPPAD